MRGSWNLRTQEDFLGALRVFLTFSCVLNMDRASFIAAATAAIAKVKAAPPHIDVAQAWAQLQYDWPQPTLADLAAILAACSEASSWADVPWCTLTSAHVEGLLYVVHSNPAHRSEAAAITWAVLRIACSDMAGMSESARVAAAQLAQSPAALWHAVPIDSVRQCPAVLLGIPALAALHAVDAVHRAWAAVRAVLSIVPGAAPAFIASLHAWTCSAEHATGGAAPSDEMAASVAALLREQLPLESAPGSYHAAVALHIAAQALAAQSHPASEPLQQFRAIWSAWYAAWAPLQLGPSLAGTGADAGPALGSLESAEMPSQHELLECAANMLELAITVPGVPALITGQPAVLPQLLACSKLHPPFQIALARLTLAVPGTFDHIAEVQGWDVSVPLAVGARIQQLRDELSIADAPTSFCPPAVLAAHEAHGRGTHEAALIDATVSALEQAVAQVSAPTSSADEDALIAGRLPTTAAEEWRHRIAHISGVLRLCQDIHEERGLLSKADAPAVVHCSAAQRQAALTQAYQLALQLTDARVSAAFAGQAELLQEILDTVHRVQAQARAMLSVQLRTSQSGKKAA